MIRVQGERSVRSGGALLADVRGCRVFGGASSAAALEVENAVLRHELAVLRRKLKRPPLQRRSRLLLAAASTLLPRERWSVFPVSPQTLLRWHRELVARKWTHRRRSPGCPRIDRELRELVCASGGRMLAQRSRSPPSAAMQYWFTRRWSASSASTRSSRAASSAVMSAMGAT